MEKQMQVFVFWMNQPVHISWARDSSETAKAGLVEPWCCRNGNLSRVKKIKNRNIRRVFPQHSHPRLKALLKILEGVGR